MVGDDNHTDLRKEIPFFERVSFFFMGALINIGFASFLFAIILLSIR